MSRGELVCSEAGFGAVCGSAGGWKEGGSAGRHMNLAEALPGPLRNGNGSFAIG